MIGQGRSEMYGRKYFLLTAVFLAAAILIQFGPASSANSLRMAKETKNEQPNSSKIKNSRSALPLAGISWRTVANNGFYIPKTKKLYNSYNQPSVSVDGSVVFRARGKGHPRATGIYFRNMVGGYIDSFADLLTEVPYPNNLGTSFNEFPSIPRISPNTALVATRGNHQPVYEYVLPDKTETRAGTTGIYVVLDKQTVVTGAAKLGSVPEFEFFAVPGTKPAVPFDVFPGSPAITDDGTIVFKGNYTEDGISKTGAFFRPVLNTPAGGYSSPKVLATSDTEIPNAPPSANFKIMTFGSVAPPTAAGFQAVFVALDNEDDPHFGGIYLAQLVGNPDLVPLVEIGKPVPGIDMPPVRKIGEALSFDGRFVAFWAAWGNETKTVRLYCPEEGNADRRAFCNGLDPLSRFDKELERWFQEKPVPLYQGLFVLDTYSDTAYKVSDTEDFDDFLFWGYTGMVPGGGHEGGDDSDGEEPRWRSSAYASVYDGRIAFKARTGYLDKKNTYFEPVDGIYLREFLDAGGISTVIETGMDGGILDPTMPPPLQLVYPITEVGIEREGLRGRNLVINAKMGTEEDGWGGIYFGSIGSLAFEAKNIKR